MENNDTTDKQAPYYSCFTVTSQHVGPSEKNVTALVLGLEFPLHEFEYF